jgi:hypothetical protein
MQSAYTGTCTVMRTSVRMEIREGGELRLQPVNPLASVG